MGVFISGSNGFVGGWITRELLAQKYRIIGSGRGSCTNSEVDSYYTWDIAHEDYPKELLDERIDAIIHAASIISVNDWDMQLSLTNVVGTQRMMRFCNDSGCKCFVLISSGPVIGTPCLNETITEKHAICPQTMYHSTKAAQELMVSQLGSKGIQFYILRPSSPIAPIMNRKTIFSIFVENALKGKPLVINGNGTRRQNYIDLRDFSRVIERILEGKITSGIYNVANDYTVSNIELAKKCIQIANSRSTIVFSGIPDPSDEITWNYDISKIRKEMGCSPSIPIEQTIKDTIEYLEGKLDGQ